MTVEFAELKENYQETCEIDCIDYSIKDLIKLFIKITSGAVLDAISKCNFWK